MGRPTDEKKEKTVKLRISDELYREIESRGENISEMIRGLIRDGLNYVPQKKSETERNNVPQNGLKNENRESVIQNVMSEDTYRELSGMCRASGISLVGFMDSVSDLFSEGKIYVDGLTIRTRGEIDTSGFMDMCHRVNADPQEMIDKLTRSLLKG